MAAQADEGSSGSAPAAATDDGAVAAEQLVRGGQGVLKKACRVVADLLGVRFNPHDAQHS